MSKTTSNRLFALILLLGMILSLAATPHSAQAAATADPTFSFGTVSQHILPTQQAEVDFSYSVDNSFSTAKNNISIDSRLTISAPGYDLAGLAITAKDSGGNTLGNVTLQSGQTSFWLSNFGGSLSRHAVKRDANFTRSYKLFFTPSRNMSGLAIQLSGQTFIGQNKAFSRNSGYSNLSATANASVRVTIPPVMSSSNLSGPYKGSIDKMFEIALSNPDSVISYSNLNVEYLINSDSTVAPVVNLFKYSLDGGASWLDVHQNTSPTAGTLSGTIGELSLNANQKISPNILVKINFANTKKDALFPVTLILRDPASSIVMDSLSSVMAVNTTKPNLETSDLSGTYSAGVVQEFHVSAINPADGTDFTSLSLKLDLIGHTYANIQLLQYYDYEAQTWVDMLPASSSSSATYAYPSSLTLHALPPDSSVTVKFRVAFKYPGTYNFSLALADGTTSGLPSTTAIAYVNPNMPSLDMADFASPLTVDVESDPFTLSISNPTSGASYTNVRVEYTLSGSGSVSVNDIASFQCLLGTSYQNASKVQGSGVVTGVLPPLAGQALGINASLSYTCKMNVVTAGSYTLTLNLINTLPTPTVISGMSLAFDVVPQDLPVTGQRPIYLPFVMNNIP